jgi:hypothetical protein
MTSMTKTMTKHGINDGSNLTITMFWCSANNIHSLEKKFMMSIILLYIFPSFRKIEESWIHNKDYISSRINLIGHEMK